MLRTTTLLLAAALMAQSAQAGVLYTWQQVQPSTVMPANVNLEMVFSDKAIASGHVSLDFQNGCYSDEASCFDPQSSLLSLRYWFEWTSPSGATIKYNLIQFDHRVLPRYWSDTVKMDISFLDGGLLSGNIFVSDTNTDFQMDSNGSLFNLVTTNSDEGSPCGLSTRPDCGGELGLLRATANVAEVPEPATPAIAGLGLLAAWFARRRRR